MRISYYESVTDPISIELTLEWHELAALLEDRQEHTCDPDTDACKLKALRAAWSPGVVPNASRRAGQSVTALSCLVFDLDHLPESEVSRIASHLDTTGLAYIAHTTHSHQPPLDNCLRVVVPLSRDLKNEGDFTAFALQVKRARTAAEELLGFKADVSTKDPSRVYFLPTSPTGAPSFFTSVEGASLDLDSLLTGPEPVEQQAAPAPTEPSPHLTVVLPDDPPPPVDMHDLWDQLKRIRKPESIEIVKVMLKGMPLAPRGMRDNTVVRAASIIAGKLPQIHPDVAVFMMRPSIAAMEYHQGEAENFDFFMQKARDAFIKAAGRRNLQLAEYSNQNEKLLGRITASRQPKKKPEEEHATTGDPTYVGEEWHQRLILLPFDPESAKPAKLAQVPLNAHLILENSEEWVGKLRFNLLTKNVDLSPGAPIPEDISPNVLPTEVTNWLAGSDYKLVLRESDVAAQILAVAWRNRYDPVADYLRSVRWDGVPRLNRMLPDLFNASCQSGDGSDITAYVEAVSAAFMISCVARALDPGCQVDTVLILESEEQGLLKSSALRVLGGPFYSSMRVDLRNKDALMVAGRSWIIELPELDNFSRAEASLAKGFFTEVDDVFRPPYGRAVEAWPRRCVFAGTTNELDYLSDLQNRRYWPITILKLVNLAALAALRDQLWAEAVIRYEAEEPYHFSDEMAAMARDVVDDRRVLDTYAASIELWWERMRLQSRPDHVTTHQVATQVLMIPEAQATLGHAQRIGRALRSLGFRTSKRVPGTRERMYVPNERLRNKPQKTQTMQSAAADIGRTKIKSPAPTTEIN